MELCVDQLITLFDDCFYDDFNTRLIKGDDEPVYLPANNTITYHRIIFAHGFFASALHEIAHWCLAGDKRRLLEDYGYWYNPDGRDKVQQNAFEKVEVKPQAIEWAFCLSCGLGFNVSVDNLDGYQPDRHQFRGQVAGQALQYLCHGFPPRAQQFINALQQYYQQQSLRMEQFAAETLETCY